MSNNEKNPLESQSGRVRGTHEVGLSRTAQRKKTLGDVSNSLLGIKNVQQVAKAKSDDTLRTRSRASPIDPAQIIQSRPNTPLRFSKSASNLRTPTRASHATRQENGKERLYRGIGRGKTPETITDRVVSNGGYSSLQEMLESSGFADTRVITPITVRSKNSLDPARVNYATVESPFHSASPTRGRSKSSVYPPHKHDLSRLPSAPPTPSITKKDIGAMARPSTSMKLLRGMLSLWKTTSPPQQASNEDYMVGANTRDEVESEISEEEVRSREASRARSSEWLVEIAALELRTTGTSEPISTSISIPTLNTTIKNHRRPQGPVRLSLPGFEGASSQSILASRSLVNTMIAAPAFSHPISTPAIDAAVTAFAFEPRPLILSSASSSVCSSVESDISFSSRTMGRRVFSRADSIDGDAEESNEVRTIQLDAIGLLGDGPPILGYQSFSLGNFTEAYDENLTEGARRQYDDDDDDIHNDGLVEKRQVTSLSQGVLASTLKHWQSLIHFPTAVRLSATPPPPSLSPALTTSLPASIPLDYSPSLPRPSFLDAPYRQKCHSNSTALRATKSTLDLRPPTSPASSSGPGSACLLRRTISTTSMRPPTLLRKLSNPALRSRVAAVAITKEYGAALMS